MRDACPSSSAGVLRDDGTDARSHDEASVVVARVTHHRHTSPKQSYGATQRLGREAAARSEGCAVGGPSGGAPSFVRVAKKYREVRRLLKQAGWTRVRQTGSHETWESRDGTRSVTVAGKDSDTVPAGTLGAMRRATDLDHLR